MAPRSRSSRRSEAPADLTAACPAAPALALYALAAPFARVAAQRPVELDAVAVGAGRSARARLAENSHGGGVPRDARARARFGGRLCACGRQRLRNARRGGQLHEP